MSATERAAQRLATNCQGAPGQHLQFFPILIIVRILIAVAPYLIKCLMKSAPDTKSYVADRYNLGENENEYGGYSRKIIRDTERRVRHSYDKVRDEELEKDPKADLPRQLSDEQLRVLAIKTLDHARTGEEADLAEIIQENL